MIKRICTALFLIGLIQLSVVSLILTQSVIHPETDLSSNGITKLGEGLQKIFSETENDEILDVIVRYDDKRDPDFLNSVQTEIPNLDIVKDWGTTPLFHAKPTKTQLLNLANLPSVVRIDPNGNRSFFMNSARYATNVDLIRNLHPELDGDMDDSKYSYSEDDIVIAVVDSGIDTGHMDLDGGKVIAFRDVWGDEDDFTPPIQGVDTNGHGTHCASIAAGSGDANWNLRGVAPYAALVGVRVGDTYPIDDDCITGLQWVINNMDTYGIDVVSISWGGPPFGEYDNMAFMVDLVVESGMVVCVAAGNDGDDSDTISSPGTAKYAITVGNAEDGGWSLVDSSSRGPCDDNRIKPDVIGPGENINASKYGTTDEYHEMSGTSMATPFVAGVVALWLDHDIDLKDGGIGVDLHPAVKHLLQAGAKDMPNDPISGKDNDRGAGRIDMAYTWQFLDRDISDGFSDAPMVLDYSENPYTRYHEPLWKWDSGYYISPGPTGGDYYKVNAEVDFFIYVQAWGDPDLELKIRIYDNTHQLKAESYIGNYRNCGWTALYSGAYFIRVSAENLSGDLYDVTIVTTPS